MKVIKFILILAVLLVIIVVGGVTAFVAFLDPNDFKEQITAKVLEETGRTLSLEGKIEWALWPKIKLKAGPLALSNAPGFGDEPFLAAQEFQVAVATLPLLKKQVEMDTVKLYGARINLAANADGVTTGRIWSAMLKKNKLPATSPRLRSGGLIFRTPQSPGEMPRVGKMSTLANSMLAPARSLSATQLRLRCH